MMSNKYLISTILLICSLLQAGIACAYPLPVTRFEGGGSMYIESNSIRKDAGFTRLKYVENFSQGQQFGELLYKSKATEIRIDCQSRRVFALTNSFYSGRDLSGRLLGSYPQEDISGSYAEHGSWVSELVNIGCNF